MEEIINNEILYLRQRINEEIENGNYKVVEELSTELCELQECETKIQMPNDFSYQIRRMNKEATMRNIKKYMARVAVVIGILGVSGGTVYAAVSHFRQVNYFEHGLVAEESTEKKFTEENNIDEDVQMDTNLLPEAEDTVSLISSEKGTSNDLWITKIVRQRTTPTYESDNGKDWRDSEPDVVNETEYSYVDYETACKDSGLKQLFSKKYEQDGTTTYTEYVSQNNISDNRNGEIISTFNYGKGEFTVDEEKILTGEGSDRTTVVFTSTEPTTNQREYTDTSGRTYLLSDDTEFGTLRTTVLISYDEYDIIIMFTGLSDVEIHEILDSII